MRIFFSSILYAFVLVNCQAQINQREITYDDLYKIIELYKDKKYQVIVNLLVERGYQLKYLNEDYNDTYNKNKIITGEMKFTKIEPHCFLDGKEKVLINNIKSTIDFIAEDYPDYINNKVTIDIYDGECNSTQVQDWLVTPILRTYKQKFKTIPEFTTSTSVLFHDTTLNYHRNINGEVRYFEVNNYVWLYSYYPSSVNADFFSRTLKFPLATTIDEYNRSLAQGSLIKIPLEKSSGVYFLEISISGKRMKYILDSGASEISINESFEKYLLEIGALRREDYLSTETFKLADGSTVSNRRVLLPAVKIGDIVIAKVPAYITKDSSPLLLGKSVLDRLAYWKIDNATNQLEIKSH